MSIWHVVALMGLCMSLLVGVVLLARSQGIRFEQTEAHNLAKATLRDAEDDFAVVAGVLRGLESGSGEDWCSANQLLRLTQTDFEIGAIKSFEVLGPGGSISCSSRLGMLPAPIPAPVAESRFEDLSVVASFIPVTSRKFPVYLLQRGRLLASLDSERWLPRLKAEGFWVGVRDAQSDKRIVSTAGAVPSRPPSIERGAHFIVEVRGTGLTAARTVNAVDNWLLVVVAAAMLVSLGVGWLLIQRTRSSHNRIRGLLYFKQKSVCVAFQPVVETHKGCVIGAEALLRLQWDVKSEMPPATVFRVLENDPAMSILLTDIILRKTLEALAPWLGKDQTRFVAINLTQHDIEDADLPGRIERHLARYLVLPHQVHLEILETSRLVDDKAVRGLEALRALGCRLWIDEFGIGYSNLVRLHTLPIHGVRLGRSWVDDLDDSQNWRTDAITHLILLASGNNLEVIASGVGDELAMRTLMRLGVRQMQGFLFAPALPIDEFLVLSARTPPAEETPLPPTAGERRRSA